MYVHLRTSIWQPRNGQLIGDGRTDRSPRIAFIRGGYSVRSMAMLRDVLVLGSGSAGLFAALTLKRKMLDISVRVVRSPDIGVIGVGESTTPNLPFHLFQYLRLNPRRFYELAEPTWKMGIHFLWGPRESFEYAFEPQLDVRMPELPRPNGYYCDDDFSSISLQNALMSQQKAFATQPDGGGPFIPPGHAFHLDNPKLVRTLEIFAREDGIEFIDAKVQGAERGPAGIAAVVLEDGRRLTADLYVDASGFRSELLGRTLEEPFISFSSSLFNDRALVGSWERGADEPILPYTTAETMDAGWCWRIEHEQEINRGYVYSSSAISDDQAREEFQRKNPKVKIRDKIVKFRSGRYQRGWVDNVMAIGNASGFVEPLESSGVNGDLRAMPDICRARQRCWYHSKREEAFQYRLGRHLGRTPRFSLAAFLGEHANR